MSSEERINSAKRMIGLSLFGMTANFIIAATGNAYFNTRTEQLTQRSITRFDDQILPQLQAGELVPAQIPQIDECLKLQADRRQVRADIPSLKECYKDAVIYDEIFLDRWMLNTTIPMLGMGFGLVGFAAYRSLRFDRKYG